MKNELTTKENKELLECEAIIKNDLDTFYEVGNALSRIKDKKLYRSEYKTFEEYCKGKWGISKTHANRLTTAAIIKDDLAPVGVKTDQVNERQLRPLSKLELQNERQEAYAEASERAKAEGRELTAKDVEEAVEKRLGGKKEKKGKTAKEPVEERKIRGMSKKQVQEFKEHWAKMKEEDKAHTRELQVQDLVNDFDEFWKKFLIIYGNYDYLYEFTDENKKSLARRLSIRASKCKLLGE